MFRSVKKRSVQIPQKDLSEKYVQDICAGAKRRGGSSRRRAGRGWPVPGRSWRGRRRRSQDHDDDHDNDDHDRDDDHDNDYHDQDHGNDDDDVGEHDTGEDDGDGDEMVVLVLVKVRMTRKELMAVEIGWLCWLVELGTILRHQKS